MMHLSNPSDFHRAMDVPSIQKSFAYHLKYTLSRDPRGATRREHFFALCLTVRDRVVERWIETNQLYHREKVKRVYYLSMEYLLGRSLANNILNLEIWDLCKEALSGLNISMEDLLEEEIDAGLGNGGLGRLAACFMDSLATLALPGMGYGLRYEYGIFRQEIQEGHQKEEPDQWLRFGHPWEQERLENTYPVSFGGHIAERLEGNRLVIQWIPSSTILATPFDIPVVGFGSDNVNTLRLWSAKSSEEFHFDDFSEGDYIDAVRSKIQAETLTKLLYPNDNNHSGKELRFRQQYFFICSSLQDILVRFKTEEKDFAKLPDKVAIQLNDTHPAMAIAEFMRILVDECDQPWEESWKITTQVFGYTNHTLLPEALEHWPISFFQKNLPRHLQIIREINRRFLEEVSWHAPGDNDRLHRMSILENNGDDGQVRMAYLATVGSHSINGVSKLHTDLLKEKVFQDFYDLYPERFNSKTNGVTPRRWLVKANLPLADWILDRIGKDWVTDLGELRRLESYRDDPASLESFGKIKRISKETLAGYIHKNLHITVSPDAIFDVQIKRIHEYKRQLMNLLHIIMLYSRLKRNPDLPIAPRVFIFAGKAAPGYFIAKLIIKMIHSVAQVVNRDPQIQDKLKVVFIPNYGVSLAELIIPAADVSEQISTAGHEASGTGNMKLSLNGALTIGTLDGANIEILEEVGEENIFIFGLRAEEVEAHKTRGTYDPRVIYEEDEEIRNVLDLIQSNFFSLHEKGIFAPLLQNLLEWGDNFFVLADLRSYADCQEEVDRLYQNRKEWNKKSLLNIARMGKFSSDRTIQQYAQDIWNISSCPVDMEHKKNITIMRIKVPQELLKAEEEMEKQETGEEEKEKE